MALLLAFPTPSRCQETKKSVREILSDLSRRTGSAIVFDGVLPKQSLDIRENTAANEVLRKIADHCDFDIITSKNQIVILKRYNKKTTYPEFTRDEIIASATDLLKSLRSVFSFPQKQVTVSSYFQNAMARMSPEEELQLNSDSGITLENLNSESRQIATNGIQYHEFQTINFGFFDLFKTLSNLDKSNLSKATSLSTNHGYAFLLDFTKASVNNIRLIQIPSSQENIEIPADSKATTLESLSLAIQNSQRKITIEPAIRSHRLTYFGTPSIETLRLLAQHNNWSLKRASSTNDIETYRLTRNRISAQKNPLQDPNILIQSLPADIQRFLTNKISIIPHQEDPYLYMESFSKAREESISKSAIFANSYFNAVELQSKTLFLDKEKIAFNDLSENVQEYIVKYLFYRTLFDSIPDLLQSAYMPGDYSINPMKATLRRTVDRKGTVWFTVKGASGGEFSVGLLPPLQYAP